MRMLRSVRWMCAVTKKQVHEIMDVSIILTEWAQTSDVMDVPIILTEWVSTTQTSDMMEESVHKADVTRVRRRINPLSLE